MRSSSPVRAAKIGYIIMSLVYCAAGILTVINPSASSAVIGAVCGALLIFFGLVRIIGYFSRDLFRLAFQYDLAYGIFMIALGALILTRPAAVMSYLCLILGICIFADGLFKIQITVDAKRFGIREWWLILILALLTCAAGVLLTLWHTESAPVLTVVLGVSLLSEGILNLITVLTAVKITKRRPPDTFIDVDFFNEN